ncbi:MAG: hypothetical protein NC299_09510 [Lachnospiraceae bacterium]|nr:hypothetical protein [Ruminococcus sp.]MCM1275590.1 hypothetical protein [Lachnospiraceae bacterium]
MKKLYAIFLSAALLLTGCVKTGYDGASVKRLTGGSADGYRFFAQNTGGEPVEITDGSAIDELWAYLSECESGERCRFYNYDAPAGVAASATAELILLDKETGEEYSVAAGHTVSCGSAEDGTPAITVTRRTDEKNPEWTAYIDVGGGFEELLNGLSGVGSSPHLTDSPLDDYSITGSIEVYDPASYTYTEYSGAFSEDYAEELWALLERIEKSAPIRLTGTQCTGGGCIGGGLIFTNEKTNEGFYVSDGLLYAAPELAGGESIIVIGGNYYGGSREMLKELMIKGLAREENIVKQTVNAPSEPWADKPEKLTDMPLGQLEFSGKASVYDPESGFIAEYQGRVTGIACEELWSLLAEIEQSPADTDEIAAPADNVCLQITNTATDDIYFITFGIASYVDPAVVAVSGCFRGGVSEKYYRPDMFLYGRLAEILLGELVREENHVCSRLPDVPQRLSDTSPEDFEIVGSATVFDRETLTTTRYKGAITGSAAEELWALLGRIERCEVAEFDYNDSVGNNSVLLTLTDKRTGKVYTITDGIFYEHPMLEGGAVVIVINGVSHEGRGYVCYYPECDFDTGRSLLDELKELVTRAVSREEYVADRVTETPQLPKGDIAAVCCYQNLAWGRELRGEFVDLCGNIYKFDLSEYSDMLYGDLMTTLEKGHYNGLFGEPVGVVGNIDALYELIALADLVPDDAEITEKHTAYDAGQTTLYIANTGHALVEISSRGDYERTNTDPNAEKAAKLIELIARSDFQILT